MNQLHSIIEKHKEFNSFLESINLDSLRMEYSREQLKAFSKELHQLNTRSLSFEVGKIIEEMKKVEFPQLLGVHHYPIINELSILNESEKIALDKHLSKLRVGNYVHRLWSVVKNEDKVEKVEAFLLDKSVVEKVYAVLCPSCSDAKLTKLMNEQEKENLTTTLTQKPTWERFEELESIFSYGCDECSYEVDFDKLCVENVAFKTYIKLIMERDKTLDHV